MRQKSSRLANISSLGWANIFLRRVMLRCGTMPKRASLRRIWNWSCCSAAGESSPRSLSPVPATAASVRSAICAVGRASALRTRAKSSAGALVLPNLALRSARSAASRSSSNWRAAGRSRRRSSIRLPMRTFSGATTWTRSMPGKWRRWSSPPAAQKTMWCWVARRARIEVTRLGYALSGILASAPNSSLESERTRDCVNNSKPSRCALNRATSSKRQPEWPETAISAMIQAHHSARCADRSQQIRVDEAIHGAHFSGPDGEGPAEHGAIVDDGVELAVFAAGVGGFRQGGEQGAVEFAAGEGVIERAGIDATEPRAQAGSDHVAGEDGGGEFPERKNGRQSRAHQLAFAVGADVLEEEIAESDGAEALGDGAAAGLGHAGFVLLVGAGKGQRDLPHRQAGAPPLPLEQSTAHTVHGHPAGSFIERREE